MILNDAKNMMLGDRQIERVYRGDELVWKKQPINLFNMQLIPNGASCVIDASGGLNPYSSWYSFDKANGVVYANYSVYGRTLFYNIPPIRLQGTYTLLADYAAFDENVGKGMRLRISNRSGFDTDRYVTLNGYREYETVSFVFTIKDERNCYISIQPSTGAHYTDSRHRVKNIRLYEGDILTKL